MIVDEDALQEGNPPRPGRRTVARVAFLQVQRILMTTRDLAWLATIDVDSFGFVQAGRSIVRLESVWELLHDAKWKKGRSSVGYSVNCNDAA